MTTPEEKPTLPLGSDCPLDGCEESLYGSENYRTLWCTEHGTVAYESREIDTGIDQ